jgi:hypothetical protein
MEGESPQAYHAWRTYAEKGAARTLEGVAHGLHKSKTILGRWSMRHRWKERLALWDNEQAEREDAASQRAADASATDVAKLRVAVQRKAADGFKRLWEKAELILSMPIVKPQVRYHPVELLTPEARAKFPDGLPETTVEPVNCKVTDAATLIDLADRMGRLAAGLPSRVTGISDPDGKPFTTPQPSVGIPQPFVINVTRTAESERAIADIIKLRPERAKV